MSRLSKRFTVFLVGAVLHTAAGAAPDVAALSFVDGLPFIKVRIGAAETRLMIDSGGSLGLSIPQTTVSASGSVTVLDTKSRFSDIHGKVFEVSNLVARQVAIGSTPLGPVEGRIHTEWGGAPEGPDAPLTKARQAGAIGLAAFGERPLMFDYGQSRLMIYAPGEGPQPGDEGWQALRLAYGKEGPNITLHVGGKPFKFVLDTGASVNILNAGILASPACREMEPAGPACDPRLVADVRDEAGRPLAAFKAERVNLSAVPFDGILGAPFFRQHRVFIDLATKRLLIAPADADRGIGQKGI